MIKRTYKQLWYLLEVKEKRKAINLLLQMVIFGVVEMFGIVPYPSCCSFNRTPFNRAK